MENKCISICFGCRLIIKHYIVVLGRTARQIRRYFTHRRHHAAYSGEPLQALESCPKDQEPLGSGAFYMATFQALLALPLWWRDHSPTKSQ